jgi:hypothetical protein
MLSIHSTIIYTHRHPACEDLPFKAYYKRFELVKEDFVTNGKTFVGSDGIKNYLYENTKVVMGPNMIKRPNAALLYQVESTVV